MSRRNAHESLESHRRQLESWRQTVPPRAERFHRRLDALAGDLDALLERWWPKGKEVRQLEQRGDRLRQVAGRLPQLCEDADGLTKKLAVLRPPDGLLAAELEEWLAGRRRQWGSQLQGIGRQVERYNVLVQEEGVLQGLREELRLAAEAAGTLRDAQAMLGRLRDEKTVHFRARLPDLAARLQEGVTETWLADLRRELAPLKETDDRNQNPPRVIQDVFHLLSELRTWARHFGREQEVARMEERSRNLALDWSERDPAELEELRQKVERERLRFFDEAREERRRRLHRLEEEMEDFFAVCDRQPDLEERLEELRTKHRGVAKPQDYPGWLKSFEETHTFFKAIAENYQTSLAQRLDELHAKLTKGLEELRRQPLSDAVRGQVADLAYEAGRLQGLHQIEEVLRGLRQSQGLEQRLLEIGDQARRESEELAGRKAELLARQADLRRATREAHADVPEAELSIEDLKESLEALDQGDRTLEEARDAALRLEEQIAADERRFGADCRALGTLLEEEITRKLGTLRRAGRNVERPAKKTLAEASAPADFAAALAAAAAFRKTLDGEVARTLEALEERRRERGDALEAISPEGLGPVDRADVEQVREVFAEDLAAAFPDPGERLARLLEILAQAEALFHQLRQEEIEAEEHHRSLRRRFREFKDAHLRRYCPELTDRVEGLIHGIPDPPRSWRDVRPQLRSAEGLLRNLDRHARRLAALELVRDLAVLRDLTRDGSDPQTREEAAALAAEIEAFGNLHLPPATLRMKVRHAARSGLPGGTR